MKKTLNVMNFMEAARAVEDERIAVRRGWENITFNRRMAETFARANKPRVTLESFEIAALLAMSMKLEYKARTDYVLVYNCVKDYIVNPFACTIIQVPGDTEGAFEYEIDNMVPMESLGEMSHDKNDKWDNAVIDLFVENVDYHATIDRVYYFAEKLWELYTKFNSK